MLKGSIGLRNISGQALGLEDDYLTHLNYAVTLFNNDEPERASEQFRAFKKAFQVMCTNKPARQEGVDAVYHLKSPHFMSLRSPYFPVTATGDAYREGRTRRARDKMLSDAMGDVPLRANGASTGCLIRPHCPSIFLRQKVKRILSKLVVKVHPSQGCLK